jgi:hypothetical protein
MCIVPGRGNAQDTSMPGRKSTPSLAASAAASATPAIVSWSVRTMPLSPPAWARRTTSAGAVVPSDAVE